MSPTKTKQEKIDGFFGTKRSPLPFTCPPCDVHMLDPWIRRQLLNKAVLPQAMQSRAHEVIHDIILPRDGLPDPD